MTCKDTLTLKHLKRSQAKRQANWRPAFLHTFYYIGLNLELFSTKRIPLPMNKQGPRKFLINAFWIKLWAGQLERCTHTACVEPMHAEHEVQLCRQAYEWVDAKAFATDTKLELIPGVVQHEDVHFSSAGSSHGWDRHDLFGTTAREGTGLSRRL